MERNAERIVSEYEEHLKRARQEKVAARKVAMDAVRGLRGLFSGKGHAFDGDSRLVEEICRARDGRDPATPGVERCANLARIADGLESLKWYMDDIQVELSVSERDGDDVLVIRGWQEWHGDWGDKEVEIPTRMLDMGQDDIDGLYASAIGQATKEIEEADEEARISAEEQERRRYLELKAKYEGTEGAGEP